MVYSPNKKINGEKTGLKGKKTKQLTTYLVLSSVCDKLETLAINNQKLAEATNSWKNTAVNLTSCCSTLFSSPPCLAAKQLNQTLEMMDLFQPKYSSSSDWLPMNSSRKMTWKGRGKADLWKKTTLFVYSILPKFDLILESIDWFQGKTYSCSHQIWDVL